MNIFICSIPLNLCMDVSSIQRKNWAGHHKWNDRIHDNIMYIKIKFFFDQITSKLHSVFYSSIYFVAVVIIVNIDASVIWLMWEKIMHITNIEKWFPHSFSISNNTMLLCYEWWWWKRPHVFVHNSKYHQLPPFQSILY